MMPKPLYELHGAAVLEYSEQSPLISTPQDALQLIGEALQSAADWVLLPSARLGLAFYELKSGLAGELVQKFVNYRISLAVVGELPPRTAASESLRDFMREANRGGALWFVSDQSEFEEKLQRQRGARA